LAKNQLHNRCTTKRKKAKKLGPAAVPFLSPWDHFFKLCFFSTASSIAGSTSTRVGHHPPFEIQLGQVSVLI
jgi:hypothetical protein